MPEWLCARTPRDPGGSSELAERDRHALALATRAELAGLPDPARDRRLRAAGRGDGEHAHLRTRQLSSPVFQRRWRRTLDRDVFPDSRQYLPGWSPLRPGTSVTRNKPLYGHPLSRPGHPGANLRKPGSRRDVESRRHWPVRAGSHNLRVSGGARLVHALRDDRYS